MQIFSLVYIYKPKKISDAELDIPWVKKQVKDIGYKVLSYKSEPYEKKEKKKTHEDYYKNSFI